MWVFMGHASTPIAKVDPGLYVLAVPEMSTVSYGSVTLQKVNLDGKFFTRHELGIL